MDQAVEGPEAVVDVREYVEEASLESCRPSHCVSLRVLSILHEGQHLHEVQTIGDAMRVFHGDIDAFGVW